MAFLALRDLVTRFQAGVLPAGPHDVRMGLRPLGGILVQDVVAVEALLASAGKASAAEARTWVHENFK
jgi:hypothetical protein